MELPEGFAAVTQGKLEKVEKGVELWLEQGPSPMLGEAALVLDWSAHGVVAAILKAC